MGELTIYIRYDLDDGIYDIDIEADVNGNDDIERNLDYDKDFQDLLDALGEHFSRHVEKFNFGNAI